MITTSKYKPTSFDNVAVISRTLREQRRLAEVATVASKTQTYQTTAKTDTAQSTADTAVTSAAAAQDTADTAKTDAATAQSTADTATTGAATAQATADAAADSAAAAQDTADSKAKTYRQDTAPTDASEGDVWIDTYVPYPSETTYPSETLYPGETAPNTLYRYDGTSWIKSKDAAISQAADSAAAAQDTADAAQALATAINNYFSQDSAGAHVGTVEGNPNSGLNLLLAAAKIALRSDTDELMTIAADLIELGKNSTSAKITMCGGTASMYANLISAALGSSFVIDSAAGVQLLGTDCSIGAGNVGSDSSGIKRGIIMTGPYIYIADGDGREGIFKLSKLYDLLDT